MSIFDEGSITKEFLLSNKFLPYDSLKLDHIMWRRPMHTDLIFNDVCVDFVMYVRERRNGWFIDTYFRVGEVVYNRIEFEVYDALDILAAIAESKSVTWEKLQTYKIVTFH